MLAGLITGFSGGGILKILAHFGAFIAFIVCLASMVMMIVSRKGGRAAVCFIISVIVGIGLFVVGSR